MVAGCRRARADQNYTYDVQFVQQLLALLAVAGTSGEVALFARSNGDE
jgi:hypothetical protein